MLKKYLKHYDADYLDRIALPIGGIGTGTVSLGGRGDLRDWEIMNRPAKGFVPGYGARSVGPFFVLRAKRAGEDAVTRAIEGPLSPGEFEGASGSRTPNHGLPRFRNCSFDAAYPFGRVNLSDPGVPLTVSIEAFNPLIPGNAEDSGLPIAAIRFVLSNRSSRKVMASVCGSIPNFIGNDGVDNLARANRNRYRDSSAVRGLFMDSRGVDREAATWGTMALATTAKSSTLTYRTAWRAAGWGTSLLDFWDDFSADGNLTARRSGGEDVPMASLAARVSMPPKSQRTVTYLIAWHFPNRYTWSPSSDDCCAADRIGNYYATQFRDAWDVAVRTAPRLKSLEAKTAEFVDAFRDSDLPDVVVEAASFNISTLRTQTCFRTPDGRFYGWEGYNDNTGCCMGSCTHVWNYEQTTAFLFGDLARSMREIEFNHATRADGMMSFRTHLPLDRACDFGKAAADGQMGCVAKAYRDWQLSGDDDFLERIWPNVRKALEFCWIRGGWDGDRDGVMEGCQHNTMDVEYYGPNPQMQLWYLCALRAAEEMALHLRQDDFATTCRALYESGRRWTDAHLFNGDYYEHHVRPPKRARDVAPSLRLSMGAADVTRPDYQLANGCLVDQLVGQFMAHVCGLGYLVKRANVRKTLRSIVKYNRRRGFVDHFNCMRSYAMGEESALLMASYPHGRPANPFSYFTEVMTGFEYTAAIGMLYEGQTSAGLRSIADVRNRYDGAKRSPFDEAECGHHYARAMIAWASHLALTGFHFSAVDEVMTFAAKPGRWFWSNGSAWGTVTIRRAKSFRVSLQMLSGKLRLKRFVLSGAGKCDFGRGIALSDGQVRRFSVER